MHVIYLGFHIHYESKNTLNLNLSFENKDFDGEYNKYIFTLTSFYIETQYII